ncbi:MAG: tagatose 1,6-diphosphate aldolase [Acidobacteriota bacterium]|nr:tagatose 1,6-diphosphate aldolase [Acidobacteriota bacterium]
MKISPGKRKGLEATSNSRGLIAALAIDQRSALRKLFAAAIGMNEDQITREMLERYKEAVARVLTPYASAILLDPEFGLGAAKVRAKNAGLLLAYEQTGYDKSVPGRLPRLLNGWSVSRLVAAGADGVKTLLYYSPFSPPSINRSKQSWVERIGAECAEQDVPYFLELVAYHDEMDERSREFARLKPETLTRSIEEFSKPQYNVDVLKVGVPVNMDFVSAPGRNNGDVVYTRDEAKEHFRRASVAAGKPFIYLSEGVSNQVFGDALELAAEADSNFSGVLCGRATWKDGVPIFATSGPDALEDWLSTEGVRNIQRVNVRLEQAKPWFRFYASTADKALSS